MGSEFLLLTRDAQIALTEFSDAFALALSQGPAEQWARDHGLVVNSAAMRVIVPVPISAAGYREFLGDVKYRSLFEKSIELVPKTWQDGVAELASVIEAPDFIGWGDEPQRIALAGDSLLNEIVAARLEANPIGWDGKAFFADDHPVNLLDTTKGVFDNNITGAGTAPTTATLITAFNYFDQLKAPNGKPAGRRLTHIFHPPTQRQTWKQLLEQDLVIQAVGSAFGSVNNIYKGTVTPVCCYELTHATRWYGASIMPGRGTPWAVQEQGAPEEIRSDKTSALYQNTLKVGMAYIKRTNGELMLPQTMVRFEGLA